MPDSPPSECTPTTPRTPRAQEAQSIAGHSLSRPRGRRANNLSRSSTSPAAAGKEKPNARQRAEAAYQERQKKAHSELAIELFGEVGESHTKEVVLSEATRVIKELREQVRIHEQTCIDLKVESDGIPYPELLSSTFKTIKELHRELQSLKEQREQLDRHG
jgi:hypothetical protein